MRRAAFQASCLHVELGVMRHVEWSFTRGSMMHSAESGKGLLAHFRNTCTTMTSTRTVNR